MTDVTRDRAYQEIDIDFIAERDGMTHTIQVKYDTQIHKYHSIFAELFSDVEKGKKGWVKVTEADFIFYVDPVKKMCYAFSPDDLRHYLEYHTFQTRTCDRDRYKYSSGAIVPV